MDVVICILLIVSFFVVSDVIHHKCRMKLKNGCMAGRYFNHRWVIIFPATMILIHIVFPETLTTAVSTKSFTCGSNREEKAIRSEVFLVRYGTTDH